MDIGSFVKVVMIVKYIKVNGEHNVADIGTKAIKDVAKFTRFAKVLCHDCTEILDREPD